MTCRDSVAPSESSALAGSSGLAAVRRSLETLNESVLSPHLPLAKIEASQRVIAEVVGVDQATVSRDLKHSSDANASSTQKKPNETKAPDPLGDANAPPPAPAPDSGRAAVTLPQEQADWRRFISQNQNLPYR